MDTTNIVGLSQVIALFVVSLANVCVGDINSGCPSWGCLPWGSFSLSSDAPSDGQVKWSTVVEVSTDAQKNDVSKKGCVSDQQTVVCATSSGYVSIDPSNGKTLWSYSTRSTPFLPIMDIDGDVIGMDQEAMYYIGADGKPKTPIGIGLIKPSFGLMIGNNSIMMIAGSTNMTSQIFTYDTDGVIDGAMPLTGSINRQNGTFIPCSQPIIAGSRVYVVTYFYPNDLDHPEAAGLTGMMRLYAIDLLHQLAPRIQVAWYSNFGRWTLLDNWTELGMTPIVTYYSNTVYVNIPGSVSADFDVRQFPKNKQPYPGVLWAVQDTGSEGKQLFRTSCLYGPMAVYDTYDKPINGGRKKKVAKTTTTPHAVWIMNHSPAMLIGYDALDGSVLNITGLDEIFLKLNGWISSRISITRSPEAPDTDVLVFGMMDGTTRMANLVAIEISSEGKAQLRWSTVVGKPKAQNNMMLVSGQIVNVALSYTDTEHTAVTWKSGIVAMVTETDSNSWNTSVVAVF